jgi:hypothetical protein
MAQEFPVRTGVIPEEWHDEWYELSSEKLMEFAREGGLDFAQLKKGDGVRFGDLNGDRTDGLVLWNGKTLLQLAFEPDEYGSLPASLPINDFPTTTHFAQLIAHNSLVYFDQAGIDLRQSVMARVTGTVVRIRLVGEKTYYLYTPDVPGLLIRWGTQAPLQLACREDTGAWENPDRSDVDYALYDVEGFHKADAEGWDLAAPIASPRQEELAAQIVDLVRRKMTAKNASDHYSDPWDEGEGGAGWLDNEVFMGTELLKRLTPGTQKYLEVERYRSVPAFQAALSNLAAEDLELIKKTQELGGSDNQELFELRRATPKRIRAYLAAR